MKKRKQAFTLVELLVVVAIIGVIAGIAIVSLQQSRRNARDVKRLADIKEIRTALEFYFNENLSYPESIEGGIADEDTVYLETIPTAPVPIDGSCSSESNQYLYNSEGSSFYTLSFCLGGHTGEMNDGNKCATPEGLFDGECFLTCGDNLEYQGYSYATVEIGDQCWFAENLKYLPDGESFSSATIGSTSTPHYYVYNYNDGGGIDDLTEGDLDMYDTYGILYNWSAAMDGETQEGSQGICPDGWHVPSDEEIKTLEGTVDSTYEVGHIEWDDTGHRGDDAGSKLAGNGVLWDDSLLDEHVYFGDSDFDGLPAGRRTSSGSFINRGTYAYFWSSLDDGTDAFFRGLHYSSSLPVRISVDQADSCSVRCLKD
jgi:uncharacterized protein (TIGR02145 family)/prepilin-type N-terminal cleavage/methylation domain-containing protein